MAPSKDAQRFIDAIDARVAETQQGVIWRVVTDEAVMAAESEAWDRGWWTDCSDLVARAVGTEHPFCEELKGLGAADIERSALLGRTLVVLRRVRGMLAEGRLQWSPQATVAATFTDLLDLADHLRTEKAYLAAVAVAGAVLESELRRLHDARLTPLGDQGSIIAYNDALHILYNEGKFPEYIDEDHRIIGGWAKFRNKCDHGERSNSDDLPILKPDGTTPYPTVRPKQVENMISWTGDFIERHTT